MFSLPPHAHLYACTGALKFIAQPAVQQLIDRIWFGQIVEQSHTVPTMITAFFFPPAVVRLSFAAPGDRDEKTKEQPLLHASVRFSFFSIYSYCTLRFTRTL